MNNPNKTWLASYLRACARTEHERIGREAAEEERDAWKAATEEALVFLHALGKHLAALQKEEPHGPT